MEFIQESKTGGEADYDYDYDYEYDYDGLLTDEIAGGYIDELPSDEDDEDDEDEEDDEDDEDEEDDEDDEDDDEEEDEDEDEEEEEEEDEEEEDEEEDEEDDGKNVVEDIKGGSGIGYIYGMEDEDETSISDFSEDGSPYIEATSNTYGGKPTITDSAKLLALLLKE